MITIARSITGMRAVLVLAFTLLISYSSARAQDETTDEGPLEGLPTIVSIKTGAGWAIGRSRQLYGFNGSAPVYWSTGEGVKLNLALDLPLLPVEVVDSFAEGGAGKTPVVALEMEAGTGYYLSTGGTTIDQWPDGTLQTTKRTTSYIPVLLGLNTRATFGAGLPSVYIGAGGGVYLVGIYEEDVSNPTPTVSSGSLQVEHPSFTRKMNPPLPFALYGSLGVEFPLMYTAEDGNSLVDLYGELRLTEMSNYVYEYTIRNTDGSVRTQSVQNDNSLQFMNQYQRSASNVALTLGFKINIY